jgi:quercetin dioxygenase-like cupin family protein
MLSSLTRIAVLAVLILCIVSTANHLALSQIGSVPGNAKERARVVLTSKLPELDGDHLKVTLLEVNYGPGEASTPHSHPCAVIGYVASGTLRSQIKGQPATIYNSGESFYEPPNGVHLVSANASKTEPAKLLAYLLCDHDGPLSVSVSEGPGEKGSAQ